MAGRAPALNYTTLAAGALSFTAALAWNDAVSRAVRSVFPPVSERAAVRAAVVYAIATTLLVVAFAALYNRAREAYLSYEGMRGPAARLRAERPKTN